MPEMPDILASTSSFRNNCAFHCFAHTLFKLPTETIQTLSANQQYAENFALLRDKFKEYYDLETITLADITTLTKSYHPQDVEIMWGPVLREVALELLQRKEVEEYIRLNYKGSKTIDEVLTSGIAEKGDITTLHDVLVPTEDSTCSMLKAGSFVGADTIQLMAQAFGAKFRAYSGEKEHSHNAVDTGEWALDMRNDTGSHWDFSYPEPEQNSEHNAAHAEIAKSQLLVATDLVGVAEQDQEIQRLVQKQAQHFLAMPVLEKNIPQTQAHLPETNEYSTATEQETPDVKSQDNSTQPNAKELTIAAAKEEKDKQNEANKELERQALHEALSTPVKAKPARQEDISRKDKPQPICFSSMSAFREPGSWEEFKEAFTAGEDTSISSDNSFYLSKLDILVTRDGSSFSIMNQSAPAKPGAIEKIIEMGLHIAEKSGQEIFTVQGEIFTEVQEIFNALREKGLRPYLDAKAANALLLQGASDPAVKKFLDEYSAYKDEKTKYDQDQFKEDMEVVRKVCDKYNEMQTATDVDGMQAKTKDLERDSGEARQRMEALVEQSQPKGALSPQNMEPIEKGLAELEHKQAQFRENQKALAAAIKRAKDFKIQAQSMEQRAQHFQDLRERYKSRIAKASSEGELERINLDMANDVSDARALEKGMQDFEERFCQVDQEIRRLDNAQRILLKKAQTISSKMAKYGSGLLESPSNLSGPKL